MIEILHGDFYLDISYLDNFHIFSSALDTEMYTVQIKNTWPVPI
jgi:hypothetical protein